MSFLPAVRLYRNVNHASYHPDETQFDPDLAVEDNSVTSPTPAALGDKKGDTGFEGKKASAAASDSEVDPEEEAKRIEREQRKKQQQRQDAEAIGEGDAAHAHGHEEQAAVDSATEGVFSQLLLESILEQKSVSDFVGGLPDKRGALLVRFPTTLLGKSWKKRYFTLHGESLYFHEDQNLIHPYALGQSMGSGTGKAAAGGAQGGGVPYDKCKRIDIANFWLIQTDSAAEAVASVAAVMAERDKEAKDKDSRKESKDSSKKDRKDSKASEDSEVAAAAAAAAAAAESESSAGKDGKKPSKFDEIFAAQKAKAAKKAKKGEQEQVEQLEKDEEERKDSKPYDSATATPESAVKEDLDFAQAQAAAVAARALGATSTSAASGTALKKGDKPITADKSDSKKKDKTDSGPVVRGRRRSSLVNEKGSTCILLIPKDKSSGDPLELTGLNEGSMADLATLNEWVLAINARIALLNFLHSPMNLRSMARGGREILAFLTDATCTRMRIANKFTDLTPVLSHFRDALAHRSGPLEIEFTNCALTDDALTALADIISSAPTLHIKSLDLSRNLLSKHSMAALHRALRKNPHVGAVILDHNQIGDEGLRILVHGDPDDAEDNTTPVRGSNEDDAGVPPPSFWQAGMSLHTLSLAHNQISDVGLETLLVSVLDYTSRAELAQGHAFELLSFEGNQITDLGVQVLAGFLSRNPRVAGLALGSNFVTDTGAACLRDVLASETAALTSLDLKHNQLTSVGVGFLIEGLQSLPRKRKVALELSGNTGIDGTALSKLADLKQGSLWAVNITSLAFTAFDPEVLLARNAGVPLSSPRRSASPVVVGVISEQQQDVLSLFHPMVSGNSNANGNGAQLPQYPATSPAAKVAPALSAAGSAVSSAVSSATSSPATSGKKKKEFSKKDKRAPANDPLAPKIAISDAPIRGAAQGKLAIQPLQPPPAFEQPIGSPEPAVAANAATPVVAAGGATPSGGQHGTTPSIQQPMMATPVAHDTDDEHEHGHALMPGNAGERKPKGVGEK